MIMGSWVFRSGVNFRDAMPVYEEQWEVPSGGDVSTAVPTKGSHWHPSAYLAISFLAVGLTLHRLLIVFTTISGRSTARQLFSSRARRRQW